MSDLPPVRPPRGRSPPPNREEVHQNDRPLRLAVVGGFSSGKSALINALLGRALAPMGDTPVTAVSHRFGWAAEPTATFVYQDGRQEERPVSALSTLSGDAAAAARVREVRIGLPMAELQDLEIWDTPGFGSNMLSHELAARKALQDADVALWVTPIDAALNRSERDKLEYLRATETPVLLVVNKADLADDKADRDEAIAAISKEAGSLVTSVIWFSAKIALSDPGRPELSGMDGLHARLADLRLRQRARLRARSDGQSQPRVMNANDVCCPTCRVIGGSDDKFCVCGRSLLDQHRACPRCAVDNVVNRSRCRGCNLVFEAWEQGVAYAARAEEEIGRCSLLDAEASLEMAVEALPESAAWSERRASIAEARGRIADLLVAGDRATSAERAIAEWSRAIEVAVGCGVGRPAAVREVGLRGLAWARNALDAEHAVVALEWWVPQGAVDTNLLRERVAARDLARAAAARQRAEQEAVALTEKRNRQAAEAAKFRDERRVNEEALLAASARVEAGAIEYRRGLQALALAHAPPSKLTRLLLSAGAHGDVPSQANDNLSGEIEDELRRCRNFGAVTPQLLELEHDLAGRLRRWKQLEIDGALALVRRASSVGGRVSVQSLLAPDGPTTLLRSVVGIERSLIMVGTLAVGLLLIISSVVGSLWLNARRVEQDRDACRVAMATETAEDWNTYLANWPGGTCSWAGRSRLEGFAADVERAKKAEQVRLAGAPCADARSQNSVSGWDNYLREHPTGECSNEGRQRLHSIPCEQLLTRSPAEWDAYLERSPAGDCAGLVRLTKDKSACAENFRQNTAEGWQAYVDTHETGWCLSEARAHLNYPADAGAEARRTAFGDGVVDAAAATDGTTASAAEPEGASPDGPSGDPFLGDKQEGEIGDRSASTAGGARPKPFGNGYAAADQQDFTEVSAEEWLAAENANRAGYQNCLSKFRGVDTKAVLTLILNVDVAADGHVMRATTFQANFHGYLEDCLWDAVLGLRFRPSADGKVRHVRAKLRLGPYY